MVYGAYTMERKQIYLEREQEKELERLAKRRGVSVSSLIREAVASYLAAHEPPVLERIEDHPIWKIVGIVDDPNAPTDGSVNHDYYLYGAPKREE